MTGMDIFNITVGTLGAISFVFSIWVWMRSDMKIRELSGIIGTIHDISGTAIWELQTMLPEDSNTILRQADKTHGFLVSIQKLTERYSMPSSRIGGSSALGQLIERGVVQTQSSIWNVEVSKEVTEVWLVTPDLQPDCAVEPVGRLINRNIKSGKRYVYFYPDDLPHLENEVARLYKNIGALDSHSHKLKDRITLVPLSRAKHGDLFVRGNIIFYFHDEQRNIPPKCFEEIVLTQVSERGAFWQEHSESKSNYLRHLLEAEIQAKEMRVTSN